MEGAKYFTMVPLYIKKSKCAEGRGPIGNNRSIISMF